MPKAKGTSTRLSGRGIRGEGAYVFKAKRACKPDGKSNIHHNDDQPEKAAVGYTVHIHWRAPHSRLPAAP